MSRMRGQQGSALVLIIGVVAALAVLASSLVLLTVNVAGNTSRDRGRAKAFNVTEALIDHALSRVGQKWPGPSSADMTFTGSEMTDFVGRFDSSEFATPVVSITYFDNQNMNGDYDMNGDPVINFLDAAVPGSAKDANNDGLICIEAQAQVGKQKARIQVVARKRMLETGVPHGIAVATDGDIYSNNQKTPIGATPPNGYMGDFTGLTIKAGGTIDPTSYDPPFFPPPDSVQPGVQGATDSVITPAIRQSIIDAAKMAGTWYSDIASEQAAWAKPIPDANTNPTAFEWLVVIETLSSVPLNGNVDLNGTGVGVNKMPGILVVIGPHTMYPDEPSKADVSGGIDIGGTANYFGLVYTDGPITGVGTMNIIGMAVAKGSVDFKGNRRIDYNDNVIANLKQVVQVGAQIVPDTWRQIQAR